LIPRPLIVPLRLTPLRHLGTFGDSLARLPDRPPCELRSLLMRESFGSNESLISHPRIVPFRLAPFRHLGTFGDSFRQVAGPSLLQVSTRIPHSIEQLSRL
jgi:hypothetical protein